MKINTHVFYYSHKQFEMISEFDKRKEVDRPHFNGAPYSEMKEVGEKSNFEDASVVGYGDYSDITRGD